MRFFLKLVLRKAKTSSASCFFIWFWFKKTGYTMSLFFQFFNKLNRSGLSGSGSKGKSDLKVAVSLVNGEYFNKLPFGANISCFTQLFKDS